MKKEEDAHELSLEWGCIVNLIDKISTIEESIDGGWPELIDMLTDAMTEAGAASDPASLFFDLYSFLFRLYYRLKANPEKRPFNIIQSTTSAGEELYRVSNFDYNMYKWARANGHGDYISVGWLDIYKNKLTTKQRNSFDKRCQ